MHNYILFISYKVYNLSIHDNESISMLHAQGCTVDIHYLLYNLFFFFCLNAVREKKNINIVPFVCVCDIIKNIQIFFFTSITCAE